MSLLNTSRLNFGKQMLFAFLILLLSTSKINAQVPELWWMNSEGGANGLGSIENIKPNGYNFTKAYEFAPLISGSAPISELLKTPDGRIFGTTKNGGVYNKGTLFEYSTSSKTFTKRLDFDGNNGSGNCWLTYVSGNKIYGVCNSVSGIYEDGMIFEYDISTNKGNSKIFFTLSLGMGKPLGGLIEASNGKLYGTALANTDGIGVIYEYNIRLKQLSVVANMTAFAGKEPTGKLVEASNGKIYGTAKKSGTSGGGCIVEFDLASKNIMLKHLFSNTSEGLTPNGNLIEALNGKLYGITETGGGVNNRGVIFEFDVNAGVYTKKANLDFLTTSATGYLVKASNAKLYGMAGNILFSYDLITSSASLVSYSVYSGSSSFIETNSQSIITAVENGGDYNLGGIIEYEYVTGNFFSRYRFGVSEGQHPFGSLLKASNGKLYGMTTRGGIYNGGVIFEFDPVTNSYAKLHDFFRNLFDGNWPVGNLIEASNGKLYGMVPGPYSNDGGTLFEYNLYTRTFSEKYSFSGLYGSKPLGSLLEISDGVFYGLTNYGGINGAGVIFEYNVNANQYTVKANLSGNTARPKGSLIKAKNGKLYGLAAGYGTFTSWGSIFEYDMFSNLLTTKVSFNRANGMEPNGSLLEAKNGKLYGLAKYGGVEPPLIGEGTLFEYDPVTNNFTVKKNFNNSIIGSAPNGSLVQASNGNLYGTTSKSYFGKGSVFEYNPETDVISRVRALNLPGGTTPLGDIIELRQSPIIPPSISISKASGFEDKSSIFLEARLSESSLDTIILDIEIDSASTATPGLDFISTAKRTLAFPPGATYSTFSISLINDSIKEGTETIRLKYSTPSNATVSDSIQNITIYDDEDYPTVSISPKSFTINERASTTTLKVKLSKKNDFSVSVFYSTRGITARAGEDYEGLTDGLVFPAGKTEDSIVFTVFTDTIVEPDELLEIRLISATNAKLDSLNRITSITITEGSYTNPPVLSVSDVTVQESAGNARLKACLSSPYSSPVNFRFRISHGAASVGSDYIETGGLITIPTGDTCIDIPIAIIDDNIKELIEDIVIQIFDPVNAIIGDAYGAINIVDNDNNPPPSAPVVSINDVQVSETSRFGTLFITASDTPRIPITLQYRISGGTATSGSDYINATGTVTLQPGQLIAPIRLQLVDDNTAEPTEDIVVNIFGATNAMLGDSYGAINVLDNENLPLLPFVAPPIVQRSPGGGFAPINSEKFVFVFTDHINPNGFVAREDIQLSYYLEPRSAKESLDYVNSPLVGTATIRKGDPGTNVVIALVDDSLIEPEEEFTVRFINPVNYRLVRDSTIVVIVDNDTPSCPPGATCITNTCPATTVNLNTAYSVGNLPPASSVSWHTGTPATDANKLTAAQASAIGTSGNYYAAINLGGANCYSTTILVVTNIIQCTNAPVVGNITPATIETVAKKISIVPNEFVNSIQATVQLQKEEKAVLSVIDIFGREIKSKTVQLSPGKNQVVIDGLEKLPAGNYLLRVASGTTVETHKIIKQE
jgi:uncharacterized repeat protein (TIGR03803 family)